MSKINFSSGLYLAQQELDRFQEMIKENNNYFYKINTKQFGVFPDTNNNTGDNNVNFKVEVDNAITGTVKITRTSYAMDSDYNMIVKLPQYGIQIPSDGEYYWMKAVYQQTYVERGMVNVDANGYVAAVQDTQTGEKPKFTKLFRGYPGVNSVVKFFDSSNTQEYQVLSVVDDNGMYITGDLVPETSIRLAVVGSFSPEISVLENYKYPFRYDSCKNFVAGQGIEYTMVKEVELDTPPTRVLGKEFYIARVSNDGLLTQNSTTVEDKRQGEYFKFRWEN